MIRTAAAFTSLILLVLGTLTSALPAQASKATPLNQLQQQFGREARQLEDKSPSYEERGKLLDRHVAQLQTFLDGAAAGDDRWNGRLMLADMELARGKREDALKALRGIDAKQASAMVLITGATMAQGLGDNELRTAWVKAGAEKKAPLQDSLAMGRLLMTVLREVEKGEARFNDALAAATNDDDRAFVRWHLADALRDREDLPENTGFDALEKLAKDLPMTYWGSVAKDRVRATRLRAGDEAIAFSATTLTGSTFSLAAQTGKPVVLAFWTAADYDTERTFELIQELRKASPELVAVGISLDRDPAQTRSVVKSLGIDFDIVADGKGAETDAALRWYVEGPTIHVIGKDGKMVRLGLHVGTKDGREEFRRAVGRAVK
ncbi:MAG: TlpA family protein disulfide reductase [Planctomycetota bacterium]